MEIEVYTDGSCKPTNPGPAGFGYVILTDGEVFSAGGNYIGQATNNIAEVKAIEYALKMLKSLDYLSENITLYTDSNYAVGLFSRGWSPKVNIELVNSVKELVSCFSNLKFQWVKAHNGNEFNEKADQLAKNAIDSSAL